MLGLITLLTTLLISLRVESALADTTLGQPVVEWLKFAVPLEKQALFITKEHEIWDPVDRRSPGYLGKEIWQDANNLGNLIVVVHWSSHAARQAIPRELVHQATQDFDQAVGESFPLLESYEFPQLSP
jgi:uncharacterized protein (TIGR03792 family)